MARSGRAPSQLRCKGRLTGTEREAVRRLSSNRPLRELAEEFGGSHETIRVVLGARSTISIAS